MEEQQQQESEEKKYNENDQEYDQQDDDYSQGEEEDDLEYEDEKSVSEWQNGIRDGEKGYIKDAGEYLKWAQSQKKVKVMIEQMSWDSQLQLADISLHRGGPLEDKKYAYFPNYRINIKRGNTLSIYTNSNNKNDNSNDQQSIFFCRRGMRKFYDMIPEYLNEEQKLSGYHQKVKFITLNEAKESLESGQYKIHLYNLFKENGEHCQISFLKQFDMWLIASKNVTILVKSREDAEKYYHKLRYYWAKLIADEWFNILDTMDSSLIEKLKEEMQDLTFIGEHCGNQKHQHIFKYDKVQIIFYSIVENNSPNVCLPVEEAFKIFKRYNLNVVRMNQIKDITNYQELKEQIKNELTRVATGTIQDEGEGGVLYIVQENINSSDNKSQNQQKTLSCCKLKTTEYNIYRKLREMLKLCLQKKTQSGRKNERFKQEVEKMSEHFKPPKPLDHYLTLAKYSFAYIDKNYSTLSPDILRYEFISFIESLASKNVYDTQLNNNNNSQLSTTSTSSVKPARLVLITPPAFFNDNTINKLSQILQIEQIDTTWREDQEITNKSLSLLHLIPRLTQKIKDQNVFISVIGFDEQGQQQCLNRLENDVETLKKSKFCANMFQYINSKNKKQMMELLFSKVQTFLNLLKMEYSTQYSVISSDVAQEDIIQQLNSQFLKLSTNNNENTQNNNTAEKTGDTGSIQQTSSNCTDIPTENKKIKLIAIIPIAPPGSGKTYFSKLLEKTVKENKIDCKYYNISSDEIRVNLMNRYNETRKEREYTIDQLFEATAQQAKITYFSQLKTLLQLISSQTESSQAILYLDRMHPPQIIEETLEFLKNNCGINIDLKISAYIVKSEQAFTYKRNSYYYSESILMNCLNRTLNRDDHETMQGDSVYISKISFKFFNMFKNFKIQNLSAYKSLNLIVQIPLINEQMSSINPSLTKKLEKCLDLIGPNGQPPDSPVYMDFIQSFYANNMQFNFPDQSKLDKIASNYIQACLNIN